MKTTLLILVMLLLSSCSSTGNNWPKGMTPFFAECEGTQKVYTDNAWGKRKQSPCKGGWIFYDRGEPTLTND
jgi:hypothetical protein